MLCVAEHVLCANDFRLLVIETDFFIQPVGGSLGRRVGVAAN